MLDFGNAPDQMTFDLIPDGTVVTCQMSIRPGNAGEGGWLKRSKNGESEAIDAEFVVTEGKLAKRKFWTLFTMKGVSEGHAKAGEISAGKIRAILESARGIRPDDKSEQALAARRISSYGDLDGIRFMTKVNVEKGKDGYKDKNVLGEVITPDKKEWAKVEQVAKAAPTASAATVAAAQANPGNVVRPSWAS